MTHFSATRVGLIATAFTTLVIHTIHGQSAPAVLSLPEMWITSIRGSVTDRYSEDPEYEIRTRMQLAQVQGGLSHAPYRVKPPSRLYVRKDSHALFTLPGAGHCMVVGDYSSIFVPGDANTDITIGFDAHVQSPAKGFFNISAAEMARHPGKLFRLTTKRRGNSSDNKSLSIATAQTAISTLGARFFVIDELTVGVGAGIAEKYGNGCCVGVFEGSVIVEETVGAKKFEVKPGMVVIVKPHEITPPRAMTKAEAGYDIGCKLAALGKDVPAKLPPSMKTTPKNLPGTKVNSLGMTFVPVPKTNVFMCVHETRLADFNAFLAAEPASDAAKAYRQEYGYWGWEDNPVSVNWDSARAFCEWLSRKEAKKYRLPTDEEWSHASGIGSKENRKADESPANLRDKAIGGYPWGTEWPPKGQGNFGDLSREAENAPSGRAIDGPNFSPELTAMDDGFVEAAPVMCFLPNKLGIFDLGGNLREWCDDWFDETRSGRVTRGGSFTDYYGPDLRSSSRVSRATNAVAFDTGFRVVFEAR